MWLEKQVKELAPIIGAPPSERAKGITIVPKTILELKTEKYMLVGVKHQNSLDTDNWAVVGGK